MQNILIPISEVHCPPVPQRVGLTVNTKSTKMNTRLLFSCVNGNALIGAQEVICLPSGNWSAPFPVCESKFSITLDYSVDSFFFKYDYFIQKIKKIA